jgi:hypothetical protein
LLCHEKSPVNLLETSRAKYSQSLSIDNYTLAPNPNHPSLRRSYEAKAVKVQEWQELVSGFLLRKVLLLPQDKRD